jgi:N-acetylmuramic acid 6-phosphate etherase
MGIRRSSWRRLPTEAIHPGSRRLDALGVPRVVGLMQSEDRRVLAALAAAREDIIAAAEALRAVYLTGGRCLIFGAGTSGRLAVLEAAELPPTFGTDPRRVRAFMAGGRSAVFRAREGAEDARAEGARQAARARRGDLFIGVSASSVTPFVRGALARAKKRGARTVLLTANRSREARALAEIVVALPVGPEILAGSTRLKAGTATKLALNQITTSAFVASGRVFGPWMVDLARGSKKLRDRAARTVAAAAGTSPPKARRLLERAKGDVKVAILMAKTGDGPRAALGKLARASGNLRLALSGQAPRRRA